MNVSTKFIIGAILSLSIGVACASPLFVNETKIVPWVNIPQGPKADFSVNLVYANFALQPAGNDTSGDSLTTVNYQMVVNVTNLSTLSATITQLTVAAAQNIDVTTAPLSGFSVSGGGGNSGGGEGGQIQGLWLDGKWLNVTWIPGTYPEGLGEIYTTSTYNSEWIDWTENKTGFPTVIPNLPANASQTGYWMAGIPIQQFDFVDSKTNTVTAYDAIFVNGSWVDVTGRIKVPNPQPDVISSETLLDETLMGYNYTSSGSNPVWLTMPKGYNSTWAPLQSRLIMFNGTVTVGAGCGLEALANGYIDMYASATSYVYNHPINGTYYDTGSTQYSNKQVTVQKTAEGYQYNAILKDNQYFQIAPNDVDVTVEQGN